MIEHPNISKSDLYCTVFSQSDCITIIWYSTNGILNDHYLWLRVDHEQVVISSPSPSDVIPHTSGAGNTLVESYLPPMPTSMMTASRYSFTNVYIIKKCIDQTEPREQAVTRQLYNYSHTFIATKVMKLKKKGSGLSGGRRLLSPLYTAQKYLTNSLFAKGWPLMRILSLTSNRWGELRWR